MAKPYLYAGQALLVVAVTLGCLLAGWSFSNRMVQISSVKPVVVNDSVEKGESIMVIQMVTVPRQGRM